MFTIIKRSIFAASLATGLLVSSPVIAQDKAAPTEAESDEAFDEALNQFGYAAGVTFQCGEGMEKAQALHRIQQVFNRLNQLFGTDRAFSFAAAFGAGSVDKIEPAKCDAYKRGFYDALKARNLGDGDRR